MYLSFSSTNLQICEVFLFGHPERSEGSLDLPKMPHCAQYDPLLFPDLPPLLFQSLGDIFEDEKHLPIYQMIFIWVIVAFGLYSAFIEGNTAKGWAIASSALVSFTTVFVPYLWRRFREAKDIKGVLKVVPRKDPLFLYLKEDIKNADEIFMLGSVLRVDFFWPKCI